MRKYLIQDIVPAGRKGPSRNRDEGGSQPRGATVAHGSHQVHLKQHAPGSHTPHPTHLEDREYGAHEEFFSDTVEQGFSEEDAGKVVHEQYVSDMQGSDLVTSNHEHSFPEYAQKRAWVTGWIAWLVGSLVFLVVGIFLLNYFGGATVTLVPKKESLTMDQAFIGQKSPIADALRYSVMRVTLSDTREVPATGEKTVTAKASGKIIVYNEQLTTQRLIKNTRFQSPGGKIYRINESINVPKAVTKSGKLTPGSIEVTVYADEAGPEYNSEPTDFTVPGLKTSPIYKKVYARSRGPITGGASGTIKSVSDQDLKQASEDLRVSLETKLRSKARADTPPSHIAFDRGMVVEIKTPELTKAEASSADKAVVGTEGTAYLVTFDRAELSSAIARALIPTWKGEVVTIKNLDSLEFSMNSMKGEALWSVEKLDFRLKGSPDLAWVVDTSEVVRSLIGSPKREFNVTVSQFTTIDNAKASLRPFWKTHFPDDPEKIRIILEQ